MKRIRRFRSDPHRHGPHAITDGTNFEDGHGRGSPVAGAAKFLAEEWLLKGRSPAPKKDVRQGIASRRRHVAPARSLC
jgi:hypothetical protein